MTGIDGRDRRIIPIPLTRQTEMPWKNGGGTTREICKLEDAAGVLWRASIATIHASGPFSLFEGCDRIITLIAGPGVLLDFADGERVTLDMFEPQRFSCDRPVSATVTGTSHDLNLIWRRDAISVEHRVETIRGQAETALPPAHWHLIVAGDGRVDVTTAGPTTRLEAGEALLFDRQPTTAPLRLTLAADRASALVFAITERGKPAP